MPPILTLKNIELRFSESPLFTDVEMNVSKGDKICLVGRNGSGKSTLMKVVAGIIEPDDGEMYIEPGVSVSYMMQEPDLSGFDNLLDYILSGINSPEYSDFDKENLRFMADGFVKELGINISQHPKKCSGGEIRRAALARAFIDNPDIMLLDEPTNHLDLSAIFWLEKQIKNYNGAVIIISHDRSFLENTTNQVFWLDRGIIRQGKINFRDFEEWQEKEYEKEAKEKNRLNKMIARETEWLHKGVTARRKRNMGRLRRLQELREIRKQQVGVTGNISLAAEVQDEVKSKLIIEAKNIKKSFGDRTIIRNFSTKIMRGNKIGIIGPNGAGKTTLLKILLKELEADEGHIRIGKNLDIAYFEQDRCSLNPKKTIWEVLADKNDTIMVRGRPRHVVAYIKEFLFDPDQAHTPVGALSGGEKNRLMLARTLAKTSNFIILDEPTNDLDMETLDLLQEVIADYEGTVLVVSHDRNFLDRVVSSVVVMNGDGNVEEFVGGYSDYLERRAKLEAGAKKKQNKAPVREVKQKPKNDNSHKLSYKYKRALEILPSDIEKLEVKISGIEEELANPELYEKDYAKFEKLTKELEGIRAKKDNKEIEWFEAMEAKEALDI